MKHYHVVVLLAVIAAPWLKLTVAFSPTTSGIISTDAARRTSHEADGHRRPSSRIGNVELQMCQLMGMNTAALTDFSFSFRGFARRGGDTDVHSDGWGVCFFDGRGLRAFHDPGACSDSSLATYLQLHPVKTLNVIAHIRYATRGEVKLENVHPFQREMWGITWCFAHNGDVSLFDRKRFARKDEEGTVVDCPSRPPSATLDRHLISSEPDSCTKIPWIGSSIGVEDPGDRSYNPVGATDSEAIFCAVLNALRAQFDTLPTLPVLHAALASLCDEIVRKDMEEAGGNTILNFLLGVGPHLQFAYSWPGGREGSAVWNGLHYLVREPPFGSAHLSDCDYTIDFATVTNENDRVAVIATSPLTDDEDWVEFSQGELILFDEGLPHLAADDCYRVELGGHGLESNAMPQNPTLELDMRRYVKRNTFFAGENI